MRSRSTRSSNRFVRRDDTTSTEWFLNVWDVELDNSKTGYYFTGTREQAQERARVLADDWSETGRYPVKVLGFKTSSESTRPVFTARSSKERAETRAREQKYQQALRRGDWATTTQLSSRRRDQQRKQTFRITTKSKTKGERSFEVDASTPEEAAKKAVKIVTGKRSAIAQRTTGERGKTGWFQGYVSMRSGGLNSTGPSFHVF